VIYPTIEQVKELQQRGNVIPVCSTFLADTETPVSVWMKLFRGRPYSFLLESVSGEENVARYSFIGGDPFMIFRATGLNWEISGAVNENGTGKPLDRLRKLLAAYKSVHVENMPRFCAGAVGYCTYDTIRHWEKIPDRHPKEDSLDEIFYAFYRTLIVFDNREHHLLLIGNIFTDEITDGGIEQAYHDTCRELGHIEDRLAVRLEPPRLAIKNAGAIQSNFKREEYEATVEKCKEYIKAGDVFQIVLSQRFSIEVDATPFDLYRILRTVNPSPYMFYLSCDDTAVIGASPEMMVRVENGEVEVRPIAGSRPRGKTAHEDEALVKELLADPKERAEHIMLVDLGRNDVGRVSEYGSVRVEEMMHIEKYSHIMHIVSNVHGRLRPGLDAFDALYACFPAGTLSGAPKIRAMEIIDEQEKSRRGIYGGALGYIDFSGNLDTCIVIRTIVYKDRIAVVQAGAGIVADSVPAREYDETVNKARALFTAILREGERVGKTE
jgi:anthranilate synthase component 1